MAWIHEKKEILKINLLQFYLKFSEMLPIPKELINTFHE